MIPSTRARALPVLVALLALLPVGLVADPGSATASRHSSRHHGVTQKVVTQRYLTALVNKKEVKKGKKVTIAGAIDAAGVTACSVGVTLTVSQSTKGAIYNDIDTVVTDANGAYKVKETVKKKSRFRISAPETADCSSMQSPPRTVKVI